MKKWVIISAFILLFISNIIFICTTRFYKTKMYNEDFQVYSFEGKDKDLSISNGLIILSPEKQIVSGGKILYTGIKNENIQSYSETIYISKQGKKDVILSNAASFLGNNEGTTFPDVFLLNDSVGEISSKKLFSEDTVNFIKDNLYFSLNYTKVSGETKNYTIKLKVKEFNMSRVK